MVAQHEAKDGVPMRPPMINFMFFVVSVLEFRDTVGIDRSHHRLMRRERPKRHAKKQYLHDETLPSELVSRREDVLPVPTSQMLYRMLPSSAMQLGQGRRQTSQITLKSSGALVANLTADGTAYTRAPFDVEASASLPAIVPLNVHQLRQPQVGVMSSESLLDKVVGNIPAASFVIDSSGIDSSPFGAALAEQHQAQVPPATVVAPNQLPAAAATQAPLTVTMTILQTGAPSSGQTQSTAAPTPAPDSGGGGDMIFVVVMIVLVGGALGAAFVLIRQKMQKMGGGSAPSRLADVNADDTPFWRSAKHRQVARSKTFTDDNTHSDDDDAVRRQSSQRDDSVGATSRSMSRQGSLRKAQTLSAVSQGDDNSDGVAASASSANYRRRERPVRGLNRSSSAGPGRLQLDDANSDRKEGSEQTGTSSEKRTQSSRGRKGEQVTRFTSQDQIADADMVV